MEKALDDHSRAGLAQQDIEKFHDSLQVMLVVKWLQKQGAPIAAPSCALRHQMLPLVVLDVGDVDVSVRSRTCGPRPRQTCHC